MTIDPCPGATAVCSADDRPSWLAARKTGLGASDIPAVLGLSPWKSPADVFLEKTAPPEESEDRSSQHPRLAFGLLMEPPMATLFEQETGLETERCATLFRSLRWPFLLATPDYFVFSETMSSRPDAVLQLKTSGREDDWRDGVPVHVAAQVQAELAVTGHAHAWIGAALFGPGGFRRFVHCEVERSDSFIGDILVPKAAEMWECIEARRPPIMDAAVPGAGAALARLYPRDDGSILDLAGEYMDLDADRQMKLAASKKLQEEADAIKATIQAAMGAASCAVLPNGVTFTWKQISRKEYVVKATTYRDFRRREAKGGGD